MPNIRKTFSKNLKRLRSRKGLTQEQLAEKLDISVRYIQLLEGIRCPNVKIDSLAKFGKVLGAKPSELLED